MAKKNMSQKSLFASWLCPSIRAFAATNKLFMEEYSMRTSTVRRWIAKAFAAFALVAFTAVLATSQVTTGSLQGVVTDPNKAVVPGATVKITNVDTGITREATTNDEGFYRVTNLQPGEHYRVEVSKAGFAPVKA